MPEHFTPRGGVALARLLQTQTQRAGSHMRVSRQDEQYLQDEPRLTSGTPSHCNLGSLEGRSEFACDKLRQYTQHRIACIARDPLIILPKLMDRIIDNQSYLPPRAAVAYLLTEVQCM